MFFSFRIFLEEDFKEENDNAWKSSLNLDKRTKSQTQELNTIYTKLKVTYAQVFKELPQLLDF